jgi:hypothetical protein
VTSALHKSTGLVHGLPDREPTRSGKFKCCVSSHVLRNRPPEGAYLADAARRRPVLNWPAGCGPGDDLKYGSYNGAIKHQHLRRDGRSNLREGAGISYTAAAPEGARELSRSTYYMYEDVDQSPGLCGTSTRRINLLSHRWQPCCQSSVPKIIGDGRKDCSASSRDRTRGHVPTTSGHSSHSTLQTGPSVVGLMLPIRTATLPPWQSARRHLEDLGVQTVAEYLPKRPNWACHARRWAH